LGRCTPRADANACTVRGASSRIRAIAAISDTAGSRDAGGQASRRASGGGGAGQRTRTTSAVRIKWRGCRRGDVGFLGKFEGERIEDVPVVGLRHILLRHEHERLARPRPRPVRAAWREKFDRALRLASLFFGIVTLLSGGMKNDHSLITGSQDRQCQSWLNAIGKQPLR